MDNLFFGGVGFCVGDILAESAVKESGFLRDVSD